MSDETILRNSAFYTNLRQRETALRDILGRYRQTLQQHSQPAERETLRQAMRQALGELEQGIAADRGRVLDAIDYRVTPRVVPLEQRTETAALLRETRDAKVWARLERQLEAAAPDPSARLARVQSLIAAADPDEAAVLRQELPSWLRAHNLESAIDVAQQALTERTVQLRPDLGGLVTLRQEVEQGADRLAGAVRFAARDVEAGQPSTWVMTWDGDVEQVALQPEPPAAPSAAEMAAQLAGGS